MIRGILPARVATGAVVAAALVGLTLASTTALATTSPQPAGAASVDKKPARQMTTALHQHPLQLRVHVFDYKQGPTFLQKKTCGTCDWHSVAHRKTSATGRVLYPLGAPSTGQWFYRIATPERPDFRESYSRVARTFRQ